MANEILYLGHGSGKRLRLGKRMGGAFYNCPTKEDLEEFFDDCNISGMKDDFTLFLEWDCEEYQSKVFRPINEEEFSHKVKENRDKKEGQNERD